MAEILDNVHFRLIYFDKCIFRSMILSLKYERVVIVADWTIMSFPKFPKKKVRRSRPRKRERSTRRSTWESGVRRCAISWSSPSISSHININHLILITVNVFIISSSLAVMTMTVKKTEKRQQKFFTNQVGSLKPQSRWIWSWSEKDYEKVVIVFVLAFIIIIRTAVHYLALSPLEIQIPISITKIIMTNPKQ